MSNLPRQVLTVISGRGVIRVAQLVTFVLLARFLGPDEFGWFGILTTAFVLSATLGSLGFRQSFAYQVGQGRMTPGEANGTALLLWPLFTVLGAGALVLLYADRIPSLSWAEASALIAVGVAGTMFLMLIQGTYLGRGNIKSFTLSESLPRVILLCLVVILAWAGSVNLSSALWAQVGGFALTVPFAIWLALRGAGKLGIRLDLFGPMLGYGLIFAFNLFLITLGSRLAMFVIEHHFSSAEAGQFFAAVRVNEIFLEIATAVGMVLFSDIARKEDSQTAILRNARIAGWMFWLFIALAVGLVITAPLVVNIALGAGYQEAAPALQILALGLGPAAANKIIYPTFAGAGRPYFGTPVIALGLTVNVALALILVPDLGVSGGAMAVVAGQYTMFLGYVLLCRVTHGVPLWTMILPGIRGKR
ncbi:oligosaccharide flippase family protein [Aeromicrobium sp. YIM 150415]|uniref:oligosaccharide flippase family protein n=1 Tax=Aeromicrobium sp. YIM 150415 TaxID=2803912 RepID=UPI001964CE41|nr:oligosaccharide flippase family protein [Aeromicrobium sp. YIM 150415]MBM9463424.1 oligosaccharide flippase family protein [Aeromicrobium sp. YIM 150415]